MLIGVEIQLKNGVTEWVDFVNSIEFEQTIANSTCEYYIITNSHYSYKYKKSDVHALIKYSLFECCGFDVRGWHSSKCHNNI